MTNPYLQANEYQKISLIDEMTGLPNRRALVNDFEENNGKECWMVMGLLDLDNFKLVNDTYGHDKGDEVLIALAEVFTKRLRKEDRFYRYGGEEFIIVMKELSIDKAKEILGELNKNLRETCIAKYGIPQTFSVGIVQKKCRHDGHTLTEYIKEADKLLYKAKENGRNRIES